MKKSKFPEKSKAIEEIDKKLEFFKSKLLLSGVKLKFPFPAIVNES